MSESRWKPGFERAAGPLATISREPGQARKGAAAAVTLCAGVWLVGFTSITTILFVFLLFLFDCS
ncbi:hypothetical protein UIB01_08530 [Stutzerimonas decontaminans]|uniref:Uncharacterized protein n=1 Tax=Stutzerimonas stutzeri TaxID=316 RepID=A0A023WS70_STUST|nr:hypothetical protein UIB01_08530 [Stutzerimonas decontaminans]